ncbi:HAD family hydrolase, partial [Tepidiforma sp.]|uniref:HAD family hydrolase n=1 Tax=Tepidiforma sp. TaxID=2682230 RepID=UPI002ADD6784
MRYRLLAMDLDGTLLDGAGGVSPRTAAALRMAAEAGMVVAPATARWYQAAVRPFAAMGLEVAAIGSAGADVRGPGGRVVAQRFLPPDFVRFVAELCDRAGWLATVATPGFAYCRSNELPPWAANAPEWLRPVTSLRELEGDGVLAVLAEPGADDAALAELRGWADRVELFEALAFTGDGMVSATAKGVDKGWGLHALCSALGIAPGEVVAVGDSEVDVPMFREAGLAVAVASGTEAA